MQCLHHDVNFILAKDRLPIANKADALGQIGRHFGFEGAAVNKGDDRVQMLRTDAKGGFQGFEVLVVLSQRVLELEVRL